MESLGFAVRPRLVFRVLTAAVIVLVAFSVMGQVSKHFLGHGRLFGFVQIFHVDFEPSVPAVFSVFVLMANALVLWVIGAAERRRGAPALGWLGLAVLFAYLALDEGAELHDLATKPLRATFDLGGFFYFAWVIPGLVVVILLSLIYARFIFALPSHTRRWFIVAGAMYVVGALGVEMVGGAYRETMEEPNFRYELIVTVEETLEMFAVVLLLRTLLIHASTRVSDLRIRFGGGEKERGEGEEA